MAIQFIKPGQEQQQQTIIDQTCRYELFLKIINNETEACISSIEDNQLNVNSLVNNFSWTILHCASFIGNQKLVEYLLKRGADPSLRNNQGMVPVQLAEHANQIHIVHFINQFIINHDIIQQYSSLS